MTLARHAATVLTSIIHMGSALERWTDSPVGCREGLWLVPHNSQRYCGNHRLVSGNARSRASRCPQMRLQFSASDECAVDPVEMVRLVADCFFPQQSPLTGTRVGAKPVAVPWLI